MTQAGLKPGLRREHGNHEFSGWQEVPDVFTGRLHARGERNGWRSGIERIGNGFEFLPRKRSRRMG
jgi:hypothetical protein